MRSCWVLLFLVAGCEGKSVCPEGTKQFGDPPRKGFEVICKKQGMGDTWTNHGPKTRWHMTGQKKMEGTFVDGKEHGIRTEWSEAGKKLSEKSFAAGKLEGKTTEWSPDGKKLKETTYKAGVRHGIETIFHPTGQKKSEGRYKHDTLMGGLKTWLPDGTPVAELEWVPYELSFYRMGPEAKRTDGDKEVVKPFEISISEVTVAQYRACVAAKTCSAPDTEAGCNWGVAGRDNHPVNCVDWAQAKVFAKWAGGRLPTPGEWEFVGRSGGRETPYPWGADAPSCDKAVMAGCGSGTAPVCSKPAGKTINAECDLAGNVAEWVDVRKDAPEGTRDVRGGSYATPPKDLLATRIETVDSKTRRPTIGLRVAKSVGSR